MPPAVPSAEPEPIPPPRANPDLAGHAAAEDELRRLYESGRLPHAILIGGPRGIGKATLAFRLARFLLAEPAERSGSGLATLPSGGAFRRTAAGGHADLLTVERAYDARRQRLRGEIVVEDARAIGAFLHLTPAEGGWRIVVVDGADEMNRNAANALLKILEEPPRRSLLLLVAHSPGRLLPTIRSRSRRLRLAPLAGAQVRALLRRYRPAIDDAEAAALAALAGGSIGRALELAEAGGAALYRELIALVGQGRRLDMRAAHAFADRLARPEAEGAYRAVAELLLQFLARLATGAARGAACGDEIVAGEAAAMHALADGAGAGDWAGLRGDLEAAFARTDGLNLDRKQALLSGFFAIARLAR